MTMPKRGTEEYRWWRAGAVEENRLHYEGMSRDIRVIHDYVMVTARSGDSADKITAEVACVFTAGWSFRRKFALAWKMLFR